MPWANPHDADRPTVQCNSGANVYSVFWGDDYVEERLHGLDFHDFRFFQLEEVIDFLDELVRRLLHIGDESMGFVFG